MHKLVWLLWATSCASFASVAWGAADADGAARAPCPKSVTVAAHCYTGQDKQGAFYWIAKPEKWNKVLVVHAHGGPELGPSRPERTEQDLNRWSVVVNAGYAWVGSTYRRGGYGVSMAAQDTEQARQIFVQGFGQPRRTLLHGQSYGGGVASKAIELVTSSQNGNAPYDGVLLTNAVLGGGAVAYDFRLDLRVVYQYMCGNHPRPEEAQYPLWMGLPDGATLSRAELSRRVDECTGVLRPAAARTPDQQKKLTEILNVVRIPERSLIGHLNWATWLFADVVHKRLDGHNPFGNEGAVYRGSSDDTALNAGVLRYREDPAAVAQINMDSAPNGHIPVPVLSLHAINDPIAFVELESNYRDVVAHAGQADRLVQVFSDESEHSYLSDPEYPAALAALLDWIDQGNKPTPQKVADLCEQYRSIFAGKCHVQPGFQPEPLDHRVAARKRP
ncbi:MAG: hypothetical protein V4858_09290 [Pseudomonadota bacterium]